MSLLLNVPYAEKDEAKSMGARWNPELKKWYVADKKDYHKFTKWYKDKNANLIVMDHLYIVVGKQNCFKCKKQTNVVSFASDLYFSIDDEYFELFDEDINFISDVEGIPEPLLDYLNDNFKFYNGYSKFAQASYLGNHCNHCGVLQGDFYLHHEPDSPFFIDSAEKVKELRILRVKLPFDLQISGSFSLCSGNYLIKKHGQFEEFDINLRIE